VQNPPAICAYLGEHYWKWREAIALALSYLYLCSMDSIINTPIGDPPEVSVISKAYADALHSIGVHRWVIAERQRFLDSRLLLEPPRL
jgi:hypothetical protein